MRLMFSRQARADLIRIGDAIAQNNPVRAITFVDELQAKCLILVEHPLIYSLVPRHESKGIRRIVHGNYLIFYRVDADSVTILHVLYGGMDYETMLFPEDSAQAP